MATIIDALVVTLGLDTKEVKEGVQEAKGEFEGLATVASKALAIIGGIAMLKSMVGSYLDGAAAVGQLSKELRVDAVELQAWSAVAKQTGGSAEGLQGSIKAINTSLNAVYMTGSNYAAPALVQLGISARDAAGHIKPASDVLLELSGRFAGMSQRQALRLGEQMGMDRPTIELLQRGRGAVEDMLKTQREMAAYNKRDIEIATAANNALDNLGRAWQGAAAIGMRLLVPALTWITEGLTAVVMWMRANEPFVIAFFSAFAAILAMLVIPTLYRMAAANIAALWPIIAVGLAVAAVAGIIAFLVDDFLAWSEGGGNLFGTLWVELDKLLQQGKALLVELQPLIDWVLDFGAALGGIALDAFIAGLGTIIDAVISVIKIFGHLKDLALAVFNGDLMGAVKAFNAALGEVFGFLCRMHERVKEFLGGAVSKIKGLFGFGGNDDEEPAPEAGKPGKSPAPASPGNQGNPGAMALPSAAAAVSPASVNNTTNNTRKVDANTSIGAINIYPPSGDPESIGQGIGSAVQGNMNRMVFNADSGVDL